MRTSQQPWSSVMRIMFDMLTDLPPPFLHAEMHNICDLHMSLGVDFANAGFIVGICIRYTSFVSVLSYCKWHHIIKGKMYYFEKGMYKSSVIDDESDILNLFLKNGSLNAHKHSRFVYGTYVFDTLLHT